MIIIIAILIFSLIIIFHELGHFLLAKANHITVTEFAVGMGPILLKTTRGETTYALKLLPFGGSCAMLGEDEEESGEGSFNSKSDSCILSVYYCDQLFGQRPGEGSGSGGRFAGSGSRSGSGGCDHFLQWETHLSWKGTEHHGFHAWNSDG